MARLGALIAAAEDRPLHAVPVPEWGDCVVHLRPMTLAERLALDALVEDGSLPFSKLLARVLLDADGAPAFDSLEEGVAVLESKNPEVVARLGREAMAFHRLRPEDTRAAAKNSDAGRSA